MRFFFLFFAIFFFTIYSCAQNEAKILSDYFSSLNEKQDWEITSIASSNKPSIKYCYITQKMNGLKLAKSIVTVVVKDNKVMNVKADFIKEVAPSSVPSLSAKDALLKAFQYLNVQTNATITETTLAKNKFSFVSNDLKQSIPVTLNYCLDKKNEIKLAWDLNFKIESENNWWSVQIDAQSGDLLFKNNWVLKCSFDCENLDGHTIHAKNEESEKVISSLMAPPPTAGTDSYFVFALPVESPSFGNQSLVINPADLIASPYGWHDTDGVSGFEYTSTLGNNVWASEDLGNLDELGISPSGGSGPNLTFNFPLNQNIPMAQNLDAATTNLFYTNNMIHDIFHFHGFDEISGNFQSNNYSQNGLGNDFVFAQSQDGGGTNNANMGTPEEGQSPAMQMYIWNDPSLTNVVSILLPTPLAAQFDGSVAQFDGGIPVPVFGSFVYIDDATAPDVNDGCEAAQNAIAGKIVLINRGTCTFTEKIQFLQQQGAIGVIVVNYPDFPVIVMGGIDPGNIVIPAVMINNADGQLIIDYLLAGNSISGSLQNTSSALDRDSDFDNGIIVHEYGHGISNRLVGGAFNVNCLSNDEQMGEGWSDYFALMLTMKASDQANDPRPIATYAAFQPTTGTGIRPAPYCRDFSVNNYTFAATNSTDISRPHGIGFIWATMLWDMTWDLIDQYGFTSNIKTGIGGNTIAMKLVVEGLKLTPCDPGFENARDAILEADQILYNGTNRCLIWKAFAKRGLGLNASHGVSFSRFDQTEAFDFPACSGVSLNQFESQNIQIYPNPTENNVTLMINSEKTERTFKLYDLRGTLLHTSKSLLSEIQIDLSSFEKGSYLIEVADAMDKQIFEVVKY